MRLKLAVIAVFTLIKFLTLVVRSRAAGGEAALDASWLMGLAAYLQQGAWSGRDFHFTYGPVAQLIGWTATALTSSGSALDAYRMMGIVFGSLTAVILAAVLLLYDRISWKQTALVYSFMVVMDLFSEVPNIRSALLLLCAAFAYRTVAAGSPRRRLLSAAASGILCFTSQMVTPEIAVMGAGVLLGTILIHAWIGQDLRLTYPAAAFIGVLIALNAAIAIFYSLSSTSYGGMFDYQRYVIETIRGYNNTMGIEWGLDRSTTNFLAVLLAYIILAAAFAAHKSPALDRSLIASFMLAGLFSLKSAFVRSDIYHITFAVSPFVFAFLLLAKKEWQPPFGRAAWPLFAAGLLWTWPWVHWNVFDFYKAVSGEVPLIATLREISGQPLPAESILPNHLLMPEFRARSSVPVLPFPYENYIPIVLKRPLLAPVLQSYSAATPALQRFYIDSVERARTAGKLDVVYGVDSIAAWPVDGVQTITRVPMIFEYLYRHFEIAASEEHLDGHYVLSSRAEPKELAVEPLPFTDDRRDDAAGGLLLRQPSHCGLVRLDIKMSYSWKRSFFRPSGMEIWFRKGTDPIAATRIPPSAMNQFFTTYVSLLPPGKYHRLFQSKIITTNAWDNVEYRQMPTDQLSARPQRIEIGRIECVEPQIFLPGDPSSDISEFDLLFTPETLGGMPQSGYAVVTPSTEPVPQILARLGFASRAPSYIEAPVRGVRSLHHVRFAPALANQVGIAIANPHAKAITVEVKLGSANSETLRLRAGEQVSRFLSEFSTVASAAVNAGSVELRSESPFAVFALLLVGDQLQSLTGGESTGGDSDRAPLLFPQVVQGGRWATSFVLSNVSPAAARGRLRFYGPDGKPMAVTLNGRKADTYDYSVAPNTVSVFAPGGRPVNGPQ